MKSHLYVIVDVSGSMHDMGKIHLQRNLCRYAAQLLRIDQEKYSGSDIRFYQWAQNISEVVLQGDGDIPALVAGSCASLSVLSDFISQHLNNIRGAVALILSDGNFPKSEIMSFRSHLSTFPDLSIQTVAVGADADMLKLNEISTNTHSYFSENIASAIERAVLGSDASLAAPVSTAQIFLSKPTESDETEVDWDA